MIKYQRQMGNHDPARPNRSKQISFPQPPPGTVLGERPCRCCRTPVKLFQKILLTSPSVYCPDNPVCQEFKEKRLAKLPREQAEQKLLKIRAKYAKAGAATRVVEKWRKRLQNFS